MIRFAPFAVAILAALIFANGGHSVVANGQMSRTTTSAQQAEITEKNWQSHPEIIQIRRIVNTIDNGLKRRSFKISQREFEICDDQYFTRWRIARNAKGSPRWYEDYSEGADASWDFYYYYDETGHLRFVYAIARSTNGTREQLRLYYDESGKRIWQDHKFLKGPGCPGCFGAYLDSDAAIAFDANKAFANYSGCTEIKPKPKAQTKPKRVEAAKQ